MAHGIPLTPATVSNMAGGLVSTSIRNALPSNCKQLRKAKIRVLGNKGNAAFLFVGMSTFFGQGAGTSTNGLTGCKAKSTPAKLAARLTIKGLAAQAHSWFGSGNQANAAALIASDPRLTFNSGWALSTAFATIGSRPLLNSTNTNTLEFAPGASVDRCRTYYGRGTSGATVTEQIDSETAQTYNTQGASLVVASTVTSGAGVGSKTFKIARNGTGTNAFVIGQRAWDGTASAIEILNMGWASSAASSWEQANSVLYPLPAVQAVIADLVASGMPVVVFLGIDLNDAIAIKNATRTVAQYTASMQVLITAYIASGADVVLVTGNPMGTSADALAQTTIAQYGLAVANHLPIIDMTDRYKDYATANAMGLMYNITDVSDNIHPNDDGYSDQADALANFILHA